HRVGDTYIVKAASILNEFSSEKSIVSRIGGDEFCLLVIDAREDYAVALKESILESIKRYNDVGTDIQIEMSIGYSCISSSLGNMDQLFIKADQSMYKDKSVRKMARAN
ncbi:GGDEF domain-containing protein, partial [Paenibacillus sp. TAF58]